MISHTKNAGEYGEQNSIHLWFSHKNVTMENISDLIYTRPIAIPLPLPQHSINWVQIILTDPNSSLKPPLITWESCKTGLAYISFSLK